MTELLKDADGPEPPRCYNRPPYAAGTWERTGRKMQSGRRLHPAGPIVWDGPIKPVVRWRPRWFEDRCAIHDGRGIGPNGESYPEANGWLEWCKSCRWFPEGKA